MKIVIIGGVAAGMSCAARLRRLDEGAQIVVFDKGEHVSFANCGLPYHMSGVIEKRDALLLQTPQTLKQSLNLDVRILCEVTAIDRKARTVAVREVRTGRVYQESYDKLVLALGARGLRPPLPGLDHPAVHELRTIEDLSAIMERLETGTKRAVVMGGFIGLESAENLRRRGLAVTLVEKMPQIMGPLDPEMAQYVKEHLVQQGITVITGCGVTGFAEAAGAVRVSLEDGRSLEADLVVLAIGAVPNSGLAKAAGLAVGPFGGIAVDARMRTEDPDIYAAGDAVETFEFVSGKPCYIPLAGPANRQGRLVADQIAGRDQQYQKTQGTALIQLFDLAVGVTGLNEKALKRAGVPYRKIYLHPTGHAGYYPGSRPMHFKLLFAPDGKAILGAQIVGHDGVDKRIDVIATAMRGNLGVFDLEHLELGYAPQFGSAKDPINMAGFIASNLVHGDVDFWYPEEYPAATAGMVLADVRPKADYDAWHIPGAEHLPLGELRKKVETLDKGREYRVYCKVGLRSYLAYRILRQHGFKVKTLAGGGDLFRAVHPAQ
jgi:NADPH-dependent 2,4-dienoyl-CoA reductase/sulfur reductase-like enzyme/rhodanese-related sulfurtransferase